MQTDADRVLLQLAARQHQVFTHEQAMAAGLSRNQVARRVETGGWQRLSSRAFAPAGAVITTRSRLHAATLLLPGSVASHESAGELRRFPLMPRGLVIVSVAPGGPNRSSLARVQRVADFRPADHDVVDGIPCTSVLRPAGDLAAVLRPQRYQQLIDELLVRRDLSVDDLADFAVGWCRRGRRGSALLWRTVDARGPGYVAPESVLERKGFGVLDAGGFPAPERQLDLPWRADLPGRVDCGYTELKVLIEWDSRKHHLVESQFELDRRRDDDAVAHGWRPLRFTWRMLHDDVAWVWEKVAGARRHAEVGRRASA